MVRGVLVGLLAAMTLLSLVGVVGTGTQTTSGTIRGRVFEDLNSDGVCVGTGEPGLAGIPVEFIHESNATIFLQTEQDGTYSLVGVGFGTWQVTVRPGSGFVATSQQSISVTLSSEQPEVKGIDFCVARVPAGVIIKEQLSNGLIYADQPLVYGITAVNDIDMTAVGVIMTDSLPAGVTFKTTARASIPCNYIFDLTGATGGSVVCDFGTMPAFTSKGVIIGVDTPLNGGTRENTAELSSGATSNTVSTNIIGHADMSITKADSPDPVGAGDPLLYTIQVHNDGPSSATGIVVTDTLWNGVAITGMSAGCSYPGTGDTVTCMAPDLIKNATATINITVTAPAHGPLVNMVDVSTTNEVAAAGDSTGDNTATAITNGLKFYLPVVLHQFPSVTTHVTLSGKEVS